MSLHQEKKYGRMRRCQLWQAFFKTTGVTWLSTGGFEGEKLRFRGVIFVPGRSTRINLSANARFAPRFAKAKEVVNAGIADLVNSLRVPTLATA